MSQKSWKKKDTEEYPNIFDFPEDLQIMIFAALRARKSDLASELIGNYLRRKKEGGGNNETKQKITLE